MWRPNSLGAAVLAAVAVMLPAAPVSADDVAAYLERLGLTQLLTVHLEQQLATTAPGPERENLINRLASLYAQLLESTSNPALRADLEERGRRVLAVAGSEGGDELRLALLRGSYRRNERIAENHRLRLASDADVAAAGAEFAELITQLGQMRGRLQNDASAADRKLMRSSGNESTDLSLKAQEARNLLGQATFMLAWSEYYQAWLTGKPEGAKAAQTLFAELLDQRSAAARPEDVTVDLRGVEAIARSILGMALCKSLTASSATALDWLALLEHEQAHAATRQEVPAWTLVIYLEHGELDRARRAWETLLAAGHPVPLAWVRLVAVSALESQKADPASLQLAQLAVKELAARGELEQILALADRYGIQSLGESGFALRYVKGVQLYQRARQEHGQDRPTLEEPIKVLYRDAAAELAAAMAASDASGYEAAAASAQSLIGWCEYFQGRLADAATSFEHAAGRLGPGQAPEALWMAIVCLDAMTNEQSRDTLGPRLSALIDQFLTLYPSDAHAPRLVLRKAQHASAPTAAMIDQLLSVPPASETYPEAQRRAAQMLYQLFRSEQGQQRQLSGARYLAVADSMLARELDSAGGQDSAATERFLLACRRTLEIALSEYISQPAAAGRALATFDEFASAHPEQAAAVAPEINFRRVQVQLRARVARKSTETPRAGQRVGANAGGEGGAAGVEAIADRLWSADPNSQWAALAARAIFKNDLELWRAAGRRSDDQPLLERIVRQGRRVLQTFEQAARPPESKSDGQEVTANDSTAGVIAVRDAVADASMVLWERTKQESYGREALALYQVLLASRPRDAGYLRASAVLGEAFGDKADALENWRVLLAGSTAGSDGWYEAKFNVIRLLEQLDRTRALEVMAQHKLLNPDYGPEPWGTRLKALDRRLNDAAPDEPAKPASKPGAGGKMMTLDPVQMLPLVARRSASCLLRDDHDV